MSFPPPRRRRRRIKLTAAIVLGILVLLSAGSVVAYTQIKGQADQLQAQLATHLQKAQSDLEAARSSLHLADKNHDVKFIADAKAQFASAQGEFRATAQLADTSSLLKRLESLPQVGALARSRHVAVDGISEMGVQLTTAGMDLADLDGQLIKPPAGGSQQGHTLLTVLAQTTTSLAKVHGELALAEAAAASVDVSVLPSGQQASFLKARSAIATAVSAIEQFQQLVPLFVELLGGNGARTYLIEQVNPAELRAGGGFIGTYSVIRANNGTMKLVASGDGGLISYPRATVGEPGYVAPPAALRQLLLFTHSWSFDDSNFAPDFPSNARAGESFAAPRLRMNFDGVLSMDYYTVAQMLALTGPMVVPGYGTITSTNFVPTIVSLDVNHTTGHKAVLAAMAGPLMQKVSSLPSDRWLTLVQILNNLASQRHLQAYFNNPAVEKQMEDIGWSGTQLLGPNRQDYMMEVESNVGATKANYYVTRRYTVTLTRAGDTLHHKVVVDLTNNMPYFYRPNEFYRDYVRLYVGANSSHLSESILAMQHSDSAAPGYRLIDGWLTLPGYGSHTTVVFQYDTPWSPNARQVDQIYWQKEPGTLNDAVQVVWNDGAGHSYQTRGDLAQDRIINLMPSGVSLVPGQTGSAQLPSLSL